MTWCLDIDKGLSCCAEICNIFSVSQRTGLYSHMNWKHPGQVDRSSLAECRHVYMLTSAHLSRMLVGGKHNGRAFKLGLEIERTTYFPACCVFRARTPGSCSHNMSHTVKIKPSSADSEERSSTSLNSTMEQGVMLLQAVTPWATESQI